VCVLAWQSRFQEGKGEGEGKVGARGEDDGKGGSDGKGGGKGGGEGEGKHVIIKKLTSHPSLNSIHPTSVWSTATLVSNPAVTAVVVVVVRVAVRVTVRVTVVATAIVAAIATMAAVG
jgi:hypothetical protein